MGPELIIPLIGAAIGGLGALFGENDKFGKMNEILTQIQSLIPDILSGGADLLGYATQARKNFATAGDVAAAGLGSAVSERNYAAGVPEGQPSTSMYVSEVAPVKAKGIMEGENAFLNMLAQIEQLDMQRKSDALRALGISLGAADAVPDLNTFGRTLGGLLQGANLGMTALGNYGVYEYYKYKG